MVNKKSTNETRGRPKKKPELPELIEPQMGAKNFGKKMRMSRKRWIRQVQDKLLRGEQIFVCYVHLCDSGFQEKEAEKMVVDALEEIQKIRELTLEYHSALNAEKLENIAAVAFKNEKIKEAVSSIVAIQTITESRLKDVRSKNNDDGDNEIIIKF